MPSTDRLPVDPQTADEVRDMRRRLAAAEGQDLTLADVIRRGMDALRQLAGLTKADA